MVGHVIERNPAHAVRGLRYSQKKGKTPILDREEARSLIESIDTGALSVGFDGISSGMADADFGILPNAVCHAEAPFMQNISA